MKAVVFDWDLTLWNSWDVHLWLMQRTAAVLGAPTPTATAVSQEFHRPFYDHLRLFFGPDRERILKVYFDLYEEIVAEKGHLFQGIPEVLQAVKDRGYLVGVFSDKRQVFGATELELTGIDHLIDCNLFLFDGRPYKPDPQGLLHVLDTLDVAPSDTLYIGDSYQDVECAHRAGARSAAALWASTNEDLVLARQPHYCLERVEQILEALDS